MNVLGRVRAYFQGKELLIVICTAITLAFVMTAISLQLYSLDDVSRLDVSLPNSKNIRPAATEDDTAKFSASGSLDANALSDFQALYTKNRDDLSKLGTFDGDPLNPDVLQNMTGTNE